MPTKFYRDFMSVLEERKTLFVSVWLILFSLFSLSLISFGFAPAIVLGEEEVDENDSTGEVLAASPTIVDTTHIDELLSVPSETSEPTRIIIGAVGVDTFIETPDSADIGVLDEALTRGAVHYPGSGNLEDVSNMFLFGHSSRLPVVKNQAYKAFNDIEHLVRGDLIRVQSQKKEYHYRVESVRQVKAEDAWVRFDSSKRKLTLSTCNNFGSKQDRFVVESEFIGSFSLDT